MSPRKGDDVGYRDQSTRTGNEASISPYHFETMFSGCKGQSTGTGNEARTYVVFEKDGIEGYKVQKTRARNEASWMFDSKVQETKPNSQAES